MADPNSSEISLHFLDYWRVVRNRAPIILTIFMLTFMTGYVVTFYYMEKLYDAKAQIKVSKSDKALSVVGQQTTAGGLFDPIFFTREMEVIQSRKILDPVIEKLGLRQHWAKKYFKSDQPLSALQAFNFMLGRHLSVSFTRGSDLIEIRGVSTDPAEAAAIANAVAETYIAERDSDAESRFQKSLANLDEVIEEQRKKVDASKTRVEQLRDEHGVDVIGLNGEMEMLEMELSRKSQLLDDARFEATARRVRFEELRVLPIDQFIDALEAMQIDGGNIASLRQRQLVLESSIQNMENSGLGGDHPRIQAAKAEFETINKQVDSIVEGRRKALEIDVRVAEERVKELEGNVETLASKVRENKTTKMVPFQEAIREKERQQAELDALIIKRTQARADAKVGDEPVALISKAEPTDAPFKPNKTLNLAVAGVLGLVLGIVIAFFIEYLDTSVKTMDDVERFLGLPVLAVIPDGVAPLIQEGADSPHAEGYRILRAKIDLSPVGGTGNSLTMLSGGPGEGKSTTLFNLAYVSAQAGQAVLLVDGDLRRPTIHATLGLDNDYGLADVFLGRGEAHEYIRATNIPNLHVITAGDMPSSEMGAFSGARLREILADLKLRYDLVLVDSPPVLGISDGSVIAHEVDACLLVIQHRRYPRDISLRAKRAIEEVKGNLLGVVLNAVTIKSDEAYYYYSSYGNYYNKGYNKRGTGSGAAKPRVTVASNGGEDGSDNF